MDAEQLQDRIDSFTSWSYEFEFQGGVTTPLPDRGRVNRQRERRRYLLEPLLSLTGGSLQGRRVLDLGCGPGFWALQALQAGAEFVHGIDARETQIEQAGLVLEANGLDPARYRLEQANVFDAELRDRYDVVLCLGLLSAVARPLALFELMSGTGAELILLESDLAPVPGRLFEVSRLTEPWEVVDHDIVLVPTRDALEALAGRLGYRTVALARDFADYTSLEDYRRHRRLGFICSRGPALGSLRAERRQHGNLWAASVQAAAERVGIGRER